MADETPMPQDALIQAMLKSATPSWLKDGLGVRGNPIQTESQMTAPAKQSAFAPPTESQQSNYGVGVSSPIPTLGTPSSSSPPSSIHPFKVFTRKKSGAVQAGVYYYSSLRKSLKPGDDVTITGLLPEQISGSDNTGWTNVSDGTYIWLEITISNSQVTNAEIKTGSSFGNGNGAWTSDGYVEDDGGTPKKQTKARILIAEIVGGAAVQSVTTNLVMQYMCVAGRAALYPVPG